MKNLLLTVFSLAALSPVAFTAMAADPEWVDIGEGTYKEILFSDFYGQPQQTLKVRFEQNTDDPTLFRIPNLYQSMDFSDYDGLTYNAANATPMVFHTFNDRYAYFDEFDTGVRIDYTTASGNYNGEVRMLMQGTDLLEQNDLETLIAYLPEALCRLKNGLITLDATFTLNNNSWSNILGLVYVTGTPFDPLFRGNNNGDFLITMPSVGDYDPDEDWEDIGMALYTDAFTEGLYPSGSKPQYHTYEVPMQRNKVYDEQYRLVNPYANWPGKIDGVTYDKNNNFYMNLVIEEYDGYSLVGIPSFLTGLTMDGHGYYAVSNQAADYAKDTIDMLTVYTYFPGCFGMMKDDGVIEYPSHCVIDMDYILNFFGYFGTMTEFNTYYSANAGGNFKIVMPGFFTPSESGVGMSVTEEDAPVEYYNMQGLRVANPAPGEMVVRRQGSNSKLLIIK